MKVSYFFLLMIICCAIGCKKVSSDDVDGTENTDETDVKNSDSIADSASVTGESPDSETIEADTNTTLCGNGVLDEGEECEDGNPDLDDNCDDTCRFEGDPLPFCGDGDKNPGEECDDGNRQSGDGCTDACCEESPWGWCSHQYDQCHCGDGVIESTEDCDDVNDIEGDGCFECRFEPLGTCGNGVVDLHEDCDDGNQLDGDTCDHLCRRDPCLTVISCGNGIVEMEEFCDDANLDDGDGCNSTCVQEPGFTCPVAGQLCEPVVDSDMDSDSETEVAPSCYSVDPDSCGQFGCVTISAAPINHDEQCYEAAEPVECLSVEGAGCWTTLGMAVDDNGRCWYFTCIYGIFSMTLLRTNEEMIEICGTDLNGLESCDSF